MPSSVGVLTLRARPYHCSQRRRKGPSACGQSQSFDVVLLQNELPCWSEIRFSRILRPLADRFSRRLDVWLVH
jgi:hypothetical protein